MNNDITILVNSCDSYADIWEPFFKLFKIYWPDCKYRIILNTESEQYHYDGLNVETFSFYQTGEKVSYGERILRHLKEIGTKYVLVLIDDFFLNDYVDESEIEKCKNWMEQNDNIACFSFSPVGDIHNQKSEEYPGYDKRPTVGVYKVNFQAALWRTSAFVESWKPHENPWQWEEYATFRSFYTSREYYARTKGESNPIDYGARFGDAWNIVSGLWCVESVDENFKKNDIVIDYSKRGILNCSINELPRDHRKKSYKDELVKIKSIGLIRWGSAICWRTFRKIKQKIGRSVPRDYYEYLYQKRG